MKISLSETRLRKIIYEELRYAVLARSLLTEKKWADLNAPKGKVIDLDPQDFEDAKANPDIRNLDDEIFDLIQNAYSDVPLDSGKFGNIKVQRPEDLPAGYTVMKAADLDDDPEPDFFRGGKMRGGRFKMGIVGHDGSSAAINKYLEETADSLKSGAIAEMSGKIAHIMITRYNVPAVITKEEVESMLGKQVDWIGLHPNSKYADRYGPEYAGFYCRGICGAGTGKEEHMKILLGGV